MGGALPRLTSPEGRPIGEVLSVRSLERGGGGGGGEVGVVVDISVVECPSLQVFKLLSESFKFFLFCSE